MPQTVQPLARDRLLEIEPVAALGVDAGLAEVMALFWDRELLLGQLADGLATAAPLDWPKGSTWLLERPSATGPRHSLAPLALGSRVSIG